MQTEVLFSSCTLHKHYMRENIINILCIQSRHSIKWSTRQASVCSEFELISRTIGHIFMRFSSILKSISLVRFRCAKPDINLWQKGTEVESMNRDVFRLESLPRYNEAIWFPLQEASFSFRHAATISVVSWNTERWPSHIVERNCVSLSHFNNCIDRSYTSPNDVSFVFLLTTNMLHLPMFPHSILPDNNY